MTKLIATTYLSKAELSAVMGTFQTAEGYRLVDCTLRVVNGDGKFVAALIKSSIPLLLQEAAAPHLMKAHGDFGNRGAVVGKGAMMPRIRKDGTLSRRWAVPQSVVKLLGRTDQLGWFDRFDPNVGGVVCRQTSWSLDEPEVMTFAQPIADWCDYLFSIHCPAEYASQLMAVSDISEAHRVTSAWSSLTINVDARTAIHIDRGDVYGGTAALLAYGSFECGYLLLPRYKLAFDIRAGDVLLFDPHEPHGNAPLVGNRISVVMYARAGLAKCLTLSDVE